MISLIIVPQIFLSDRFPVSETSSFKVLFLRDLCNLRISSFHRHRHRIAATQTKRDDSAMRVATFNLIKHRSQQSRTRLANRMAQGDRAAIDIHSCRIQTQLLRDRYRLNRKRFVQFDQIHFIQRPTRLFARLSWIASTGAIITNAGSTPDVACATILAIGSTPSDFALAQLK